MWKCKHFDFSNYIKKRNDNLRNRDFVVHLKTVNYNFSFEIELYQAFNLLSYFLVINREILVCQEFSWTYKEIHDYWLKISVSVKEATQYRINVQLSLL